MFLACGVGAYSAGIFHLMTHAFFKALLFLAAGSVIHAMSGEQDMRVMGGLRTRIPITFWTMSAGVFAIAGFPGFSGFFSKDEILYQAFISPSPVGKLVWFIGIVTALLTSFYMFRLWFKTFFGPERFDEHALASSPHDDHGAPVHASKSSTLTLEAEPEPPHPAHAHGIHESPLVMTVPLMLLAVLSVIGGIVGIPAAFGGHNEFEHFLDPVFATGHEAAAQPASTAVALSAVAITVFLLGLYMAYTFYYRKPGTAAALAERFPGAYSLLDHKYWVDEMYGVAFVTGTLGFSRIVLGGIVDKGLVQGTGSGLAAITRGLSAIVRRIQSGNIRSYAGWLALGAAAAIALVLFGHHHLVH
jgi:NADH-quinone oxidoreductase subunit L